MNASHTQTPRPSRIQAAKERVADVKETLTIAAAAGFVLAAFLAYAHKPATAAAADSAGVSAASAGGSRDRPAAAGAFDLQPPTIESPTGPAQVDTHAS